MYILFLLSGGLSVCGHKDKKEPISQNPWLIGTPQPAGWQAIIQSGDAKEAEAKGVTGE
jgi:hypothetical protein